MCVLIRLLLDVGCANVLLLNVWLAFGMCACLLIRGVGVVRVCVLFVMCCLVLLVVVGWLSFVGCCLVLDA